jgi:hypothetical protein
MTITTNYESQPEQPEWEGLVRLIPASEVAEARAMVEARQLPASSSERQLTVYEKAQIEDHRHQIRQGIVERAGADIRFDTLGRARLDNGRMMKKEVFGQKLRELAELSANKQTKQNPEPFFIRPVAPSILQIGGFAPPSSDLRRKLALVPTERVVALGGPLQSYPWGLPPKAPRFPHLSETWKNAGSRLSQLGALAMAKLRSVESPSPNHRRNQVIGMLGVLSVGAALVGSLTIPGSNASSRNPEANQKPTVTHQADSAVAKRQNRPQPANKIPQPKLLTLSHRGDSIWSEEAAYLQHESGRLPSMAAIGIKVGQILVREHLTENQPNRLPIGYQFHAA